MSDGIQYRKLAPSPVLAPFVRCLWHLSGPAEAARDAQPIVPDGCVEIVLNLADPFVRVDDQAQAQPTAMLVGQLSGPIVVMPTGAIDVWGVRLHPWSGASSLGLPLAEVREMTMPLEDVVRDGLSDLDVPRCSDAAGGVLIAMLERWLGGRAPPDPGVRAAVELITQERDLPTVHALSAKLGRSTRWVQRTFRETVGLSPKMLTRIHRVQRAMRMATTQPARTWSTIAADVGYFDQSHLVRDFREIVGCTPSAFASRERPITDAFIES